MLLQSHPGHPRHVRVPGVRRRQHRGGQRLPGPRQRSHTERGQRPQGELRAEEQAAERDGEGQPVGTDQLHLQPGKSPGRLLTGC